jgi:hypothetical protein
MDVSLMFFLYWERGDTASNPPYDDARIIGPDAASHNPYFSPMQLVSNVVVGGQSESTPGLPSCRMARRS